MTGLESMRTIAYYSQFPLEVAFPTLGEVFTLTGGGSSLVLRITATSRISVVGVAQGRMTDLGNTRTMENFSTFPLSFHSPPGKSSPLGGA